MPHIVLVSLHNANHCHMVCRLGDEGHMEGGVDILQLFQIHHQLILEHHIVILNLKVHEPEEGELIG